MSELFPVSAAGHRWQQWNWKCAYNVGGGISSAVLDQCLSHFFGPQRIKSRQCPLAASPPSVKTLIRINQSIPLLFTELHLCLSQSYDLGVSISKLRFYLSQEQWNRHFSHLLHAWQMAASRLYTAFYRVRTKREQSNPSKWKEAVRKKRRLQGAEHVNTSGKLKDKLKMGPECTSSACKKSKLRDCDSISTDDRQKMFNTFWRLSSWESRKVYVTTTVKSVDIKQKKNSCTKFTKKCLFCIHSDSSRWYKQTSVLYFRHKPHCRVVARSSPNNVEEEPNQERLSKAPKSGIRSKASEGDLLFLTSWLNSLPTVDSLYCRNVPTYKSKKFLYLGTRVFDLFEAYQKDA